MKTSMKKKALVSSVAMLSVATLALGTATYAWFTNNTHATASGISLATSQNSSLQLSKLDHEWKTEVLYDTEGTVKPASSINGVNWYTATAADGLAYTDDQKSAASIETGISSTTKTGYVFADQINVKNSGSASLENVKLTMTVEFDQTSSLTWEKADGSTGTSNNADYIRVAVVPVTYADGSTEAGTKNTMGTIADGDFVKYIYASSTQTWKPVSSVSGGKITEGSDVTPIALTKSDDGKTWSADIFSGKTLAANEVKWYNLYVWFEGQDTDCFDITAGLTLPSVSFDASVVEKTAND
jgi:hypothetical protein